MLGSPLVLDVLMHYHVRTIPHENILASAVAEALDYLKKNEMLEWYAQGAYYRTTEKAKFFIDHILSRPFPVEVTTFKIPEDPNAK